MEVMLLLLDAGQFIKKLMAPEGNLEHGGEAGKILINTAYVTFSITRVLYFRLQQDHVVLH